MRIPSHLSGSDHPFEDSTWPARLPPAAEAGIRDLTYDEIHAMELGLLGAPLTAFWFFGGPFVDIFVGLIALILLGVALFKLPHESGLFSRLLSKEPWYFLVVFVVASLLTFVGLVPLSLSLVVFAVLSSLAFVTLALALSLT